MKYFSMFSGIGGFELGIQKENNDKKRHMSNPRYSMDSRKKTFDCIGYSKIEGTNDNKETRGYRQKKTISKQGSRSISSKSNKRQHTFSCVGFSEIDKYTIQTYLKHFPTHKNYGNTVDIRWDTVKDFDLLVAGFPCQAFSIAGKRRGFDDTRGTLFFEIARCLERKQPRMFILENVKGLLNHNGGETFTTILKTIDELGYDAEWQVLNSKHFGVPQNRERVFIIGYLRGKSRQEIFPIKESSDKIAGLRERNIAQTIDTGMQQHTLQNSSIRRLTPVECERLQGFPDDWTNGVSDTQRYKQLGNAVTVNVIKKIIDLMEHNLKKYY